MCTSSYLEIAVKAALSAGEFLRKHFGSVLEVNEFAAHDIKLELDVRSQELITCHLLEHFPTTPSTARKASPGTRKAISNGSSIPSTAR